jgi:hypothetical protein
VANVDRPGACRRCGRPLPPQQGRGRRRRYCDATCRSAARRSAARRRPPSDVRQPLTTALRQFNLDGMDAKSSALEAIADARAAMARVEEELRAAVERARASGHTWAEVGQVLGTSRQAAFQRFGRPTDPRTGGPMAKPLPGAGERAATLFADLAEGRWREACRDFGERVAARLDPDGAAALWARLAGMVGRFERMGAPVVYQAGDLTVVDVPLFFEAGERTGRVSYDRDGKVAGLFVLPTALT